MAHVRIAALVLLALTAPGLSLTGGGHPADRTPDRLWPSDHAGVIATLQFRP